ncbi:hypothetical protein NDU88_002375 [Pleurodeles waltl]|uniref:Uncharacterized protein n=1 Tax=Pleurodeles waltl TaxID=8319 RepID=A0AAV7MN62_PLEWA|nr:hypothetical protein NDU88_002375 [Pleurodeles waltl]
MIGRHGFSDLRIGCGGPLHTYRHRLQEKMTGLDHHLSLEEDRLKQQLDKDQELQYLKDKLTDQEDRSHKDNVRFFGIPEQVEGADASTFHKDSLPVFTGLTFFHPLEFQLAHRMGPPKNAPRWRSRPIIACVVQHKQVHQLLNAAQSHSPYD